MLSIGVPRNLLNYCKIYKKPNTVTMMAAESSIRNKKEKSLSDAFFEILPVVTSRILRGHDRHNFD